MSIQEDLDELGYIRTRLGRQSIQEFALQFYYALILRKKNDELSIWALRKPASQNTNSSSPEILLFCPRDNENAWVVHENELKQGFEICNICQNCLTCMTTGTTKNFQLMQQGDLLQ